ncbi:MAG: YlxR family protein [Gaiellaceae bacterium]
MSNATPIRTCAGCGRKASQAELLRFAAPDGVLTPGRQLPGRGVYTCRRLACFERAATRRAFNRILRRTVHVDPALARLYTGVADGERTE